MSPRVDGEVESGHTLPGYLLTISWFPASPIGGVNQAIINLSRVMKERAEWRPFLLVDSDGHIPELHPHIPCPVESLYLRTPDLPQDRPLRALTAFFMKLASSLLRLRAFTRSHNIRAIACHFPDTNSIHFCLLKRLGLYRGKLILSFHGEDIRSLDRKKAFIRSLGRWMMRNADAVVACSYGLRDDLVKFEPACAVRATVIYNAIDPQSFLNNIDRRFILPAALNGKKFLLNVARYEHKKGHDILLRAFERLASQFPELMLVTIGSAGDRTEAIRQMVEQSPLRDRIFMLQDLPHSQVGVFMDAAELFLLPSRREGFPFVLLEAGVMRKAVVATACIGVPEIIEDGVTGRVTPLEDDGAFAEAVSDLLSNEKERIKLAKNLHRRVLEEFSWQIVYQQHMKLVRG